MTIKRRFTVSEASISLVWAVLENITASTGPVKAAIAEAKRNVETLRSTKQEGF